MGRTVWLLALAGLAIAAPAAAADKKCSLGKLGEFQVSMEGFRPIVAAKINDKDTHLLVDSGAFFSSLEPGAMEKFGLKRGAMPPGLTVRGVGGVASVSVGVVSKLEVGSFRMSGMDFLIGGPDFGSRYDGILGQNILSATDIEYDLANGIIRMFKPQDCGNNVGLAYWADGKPYSVINIQGIDTSNLHIEGTAKVNGQTIRVTFDTGAPTSSLKRSAAAKVGFRPEIPGVVAAGISTGFGSGTAETWIAPFDSFEIGGEKITNTKLRVSEINLQDSDMLLGADFFLSHRIFVSRSQQKMYFTYNGGPVFRLERLPPGPGPRAPLPPVAEAAPKAGDPTDAAGYARRGMALSSRREFPAAIADFSKAIEMEPNNADFYYSRAVARLGARQPVLAMDDLDVTLRLKPDQVQARLSRGEVYLNRRNVPAAKTDFAEAVRLGGDEFDIRNRVATDLLRAGESAAAVSEYDGWIAAHPKNENLSEALNGRCFARALGNSELDKALADCNAALKARTRNSSVLDSRGLVYLRMNKPDEAIADYNEALKKQPKAAWPLYGRGLAKLKKGDEAGGKADMAAALALEPGLTVLTQRYGLTG